MAATSTPAFRRLWAASGLSNLADGVLKTAVPLVAVRYTTSPALIAGLALVLSLPWLVVALPAGALVDRWNRRRTMLAANSTRAVVLAAVALVALSGHGSLGVLYAAAVVIGCSEVFYDTTAQSILPMLVPRDELQRANGRLYAVELTTNSFVGPPLGGAVAAAGAAIAFGTPAAMWVVAVFVLVGLRGSFRVERTTKTSLVADVGEGLRFLWHRPVLRTMAMMVGVSNLAWTAAGSILVLFAVGSSSTLRLSDPQYGVLLTTLAVGSVVGAVGANWLVERVGRTAGLALSLVTSAIGIGAPAVLRSVWAIGAAFAVSGVGVSVWNVITVSLRQRLTPDRLLGRLNSAYRLLAWGTMPIGAALGGALGQAFGLRVVFVVGTALCLALFAGLPLLTPRRLVAAEAELEPAAGVPVERAGSTLDEPVG